MSGSAWRKAGALAGLLLASGCGEEGSEEGSEGRSSDGESSGGAETTGASESAGSSGGGSTDGDTTMGADGSSEGGSTGDGETSDDDASSSDDGGTADTGRGETGGVDGDCGDPASYPYAGALCSPGLGTCTVLEQDAVEPRSGFRNAPPAVAHDAACRPLVLYSLAQGDYDGTLARRDPGGEWQSWIPDTPVATGGLSLDPSTGEVHVFMSDGALGMHHAVWDGELGPSEQSPGTHSFRANAVSDNFDGVTAIATRAPTSDVTLTLFDGAWDTTPIVPGTRPSTATAPDGTVHVSYWDSMPGGWFLYAYDTESGVGQQVTMLETSLLDQFQMMAATRGAVHIAYTRLDGAQLLGARRSDGGWSTHVLVDAVDPDEETCSVEPTEEEETCDYDFTRLQTLAAVASAGGDVRIVFQRSRFLGTLASDCRGGMGAPAGCSWATEPVAEENSIEIIDPGDLDGGPQVLFAGERVHGADTSLDALGNLHIAAYRGDGESSTVQYWLVGSAD